MLLSVAVLYAHRSPPVFDYILHTSMYRQIYKNLIFGRMRVLQLES